MPYIYVNVLRTGLENITKLYPWFIEHTYVGCWKVAELLLFCILWHYLDLFLIVSLYSCSHFIMEE